MTKEVFMQDKKMISNEEAMRLLSIQTKSAMSKLAKKENLNRVKKWREVFYYKDEVIKLKKYRETNPHKKSSSKQALEKEIAHNKLKNENVLSLEVKDNKLKFASSTLSGSINTQLKELITIFKTLGLYLDIDTPVLKAYIKDAYFLDRIRQSLDSDGITTEDEKGKEWLSAKFDGYLKLSELQLKREKALGIGAGNRKGIDTTPPIEADEMDGLIDE